MKQTLRSCRIYSYISPTS